MSKARLLHYVRIETNLICKHMIYKKSIRYALSLVCAVCVGCMDSGRFHGRMNEIEESDTVIEVTPSIVGIDSIHSRTFVVKDTLAIFYQTLDRSHSFHVFNVNNGREIGKFCPVGHGNGEFVALSPISNLTKQGKCLSTLLFAPNESKMVVWNITESIKRGTTVFDKTMKYSWQKDSPAGMSWVYAIGKDSIFVKRPSVHISNTDEILPYIYQVRVLSSNKLLNEIQLFDVPENVESAIMPEFLYSSANSLKPDNSKFVEAMMYEPQINIVDIHTGKACGYRLQSVQANASVEKAMENVRSFYLRVQTTNDYIIALYNGREVQSTGVGYDMLHVYNWKGEMLNRVKLKYPVHEICIDEANLCLYALNESEQNLYRYQLSELVRGW